MKPIIPCLTTVALSLAAFSADAAYFLSDDGTGGDCADIGNWDGPTRTCTLTSDVNDTILLLSDGLTIDCADPSTGLMHEVTGAPVGTGLLAVSNDLVVRNCEVWGRVRGLLAPNITGLRVEGSDFHDNFQGIFLFGSSDGELTLNTAEDNGIGVTLSSCDAVSVTHNTFIRNRDDRALRIIQSTDTLVAENTFSDNGFGVTLFSGGSNVIRDNFFSGNGFPRTLPAGNAPAVALAGEDSHDNLLSDNIMVGNAYGFGLTGTGNIVDATNTVDGHPIYWYHDLDGVTITPAMAPDAAGVYCEGCTGVTIRGFDLTVPMGIGIGLYETTDSTVEDNSIEDASYGVLLTLGSDGNTVRDNDISLHFEDIFAYGIRLNGADGNIISGNRIDLGPGNSGWHGISLGRQIFSGDTADPADWNVVSHNSVTRVLQNAIEVSGSHNLIEGNFLHDTGGGIFLGAVLVDRVDNVLEGNIIVDGRANWFPYEPAPGPYGHGIDVTGAENTLLSRNIISGMRDNGLKIQGSSGTVVTRNDIFDNADGGLASDGSPIFEVMSVDESGSSPVAVELSADGAGNYWGRNCGGGPDGAPLFQPGVDSNDAVVIDSHPFWHPVAAIPTVAQVPKPVGCPSEE